MNMVVCPKCKSEKIHSNKEIIHGEEYDECEDCGYQQKVVGVLEVTK